MNKLLYSVGFLLFAIFTPFICACDNAEYIEGGYYPMNLRFYIDFQHNGTPVVDSLKLFDIETDIADARSIYSAENYIQGKCIRGSDNKNLFTKNGHELLWYPIIEKNNFFEAYNIADKRVRTLLWVGFLERNVNKDTSKGVKREETYTITLKSEQLFNDDKEHTIRITALLYGKYTWETLKIEKDDEEVEMIQDCHYDNNPYNHCEYYIRWDV